MSNRIITKEKLENFKTHLINEERSRATIEKYMRDIQTFTKYNTHKICTKEILLRFKKHLQKNYAARSINSMLSALNSLFAFLGWNDLKTKFLKVQKTFYCPEEKELTQSEYRRLCHTALKKHRERLYLILQTLCATGMRISELQFITVETLKRGKAVVDCKGKIRTLWIVDKLKRILLQYAHANRISSGPIFTTRTHKPVNRSNIWREMKALCKDAHVDPQKVFPHNLRHLFARVYYHLEKDIAKLADILGHSNINTTRIYIASSDKEHRKTLENMHLVL